MRKLLSLTAVLFCVCLLANAQVRKFTGKVLDGNGNPIPYATVKIKGSNSGVAADQNGSFEISVKESDALVVSAVGYDDQQIYVKGQTTLSVSLKSNKQLDEVVVTAQGIRKKAREIGYAYAKVNTEEINNGRSPLLGQALSGKVSGLAVFNINNSVEPQSKVVLRGYRSIGGNNEALVVVDNMQTTSTVLNLINPNDIENVTVLKGGQAATLYGSAGVNGAIIITTKKGKKGKLKVSLSNSTNFEQISFLPDFQTEYGSGSQYYPLSFGQPGYATNYLDRMKENWRPYENQQYGDHYDGSLRLVGRTLQDSARMVIPYSDVKNGRRKTFDVGSTVNNQVSFQGGDETSSFYMSVENNRTLGIVPHDKSERNGVRLSASKQIDKLSVGFSAVYTQANYNRTTSDFYNDVINQPSWVPIYKLRDWQHNEFASPNGYFNDYYNNPYFNADNNRAVYKDANIQGNLDLTYRFTNWLSLTERIGVMNNSRNGKNTTGKFLYNDWAKNSAYIVAPWTHDDDYPGIYRAISDILGGVNDYSSNENVVNNELQGTVNKKFGKFDTKLTGGYSIYARNTNSIGINSSSIVVPGTFNVGNRQGELTGGQGLSNIHKYGYYADLTSNFNDWLILNASYRIDRTSLFYKKDRTSSQYTFGYPGVGLSFILTDALPTLQSKTLNYAKLRISYNKNGNDNISPYGLDPIYPNGANFPFGSTVGLTVGNTLPDKNLKPEFIDSYELGGEFQLFNNRVNIEGSAYRQISKGQVITVTVPASTGYRALRINVGEVHNWGYEADLKVQILRARKLKWDVSLRYSYNDNKVVDIYPGVNEFQYGGYSYATTNVIKGLRFPFLKTDGYQYAPDGSGQRLVSATTGYPLRNSTLVGRGGTLPRHIAGAGTSLSYGPLSFAINAEYRGGNFMYSDLGRQMTFTGSGGWTSNRGTQIFPNSAYLDASGKVVPNTSVYVREPEYALWVNNYRLITENFVAPAWFIKIRDVNIAYTVPSKLVSKTKVFSGASIAVYGRNLLTIVDKKNYYTDPEYSYTAKGTLDLFSSNGLGINNTGQTPPVRQYGFNVNLQF
jgi:TonB-linked SusC/RagA family outer membrane protein